MASGIVSEPKLKSEPKNLSPLLPMIAITGATGQFGRLVIDCLIQAGTPAASLVAVARSPAKAADLAARGVQVRAGNYDDAGSLAAAFAGVRRVLLVSSSEIGRRAAQHRNAIEAAKSRKVELLVYTSLLHADTSPLSLAGEHRETEAMIRASGLPFVLLRNGWYTENYTASVPAALANGAFYGSAGQGRISSAARLDFAEAAAKAVAGGAKTGQTYELVGDEAYTLGELAAEISRQTGKAIPYVDLPEADYCAALRQAGLPEGLAAGLASWDADAAKGALFDRSRQLRDLIARPTTSLAEAVRQALRG